MHTEIKKKKKTYIFLLPRIWGIKTYNAAPACESIDLAIHLNFVMSVLVWEKR